MRFKENWARFTGRWMGLSVLRSSIRSSTRSHSVSERKPERLFELYGRIRRKRERRDGFALAATSKKSVPRGEIHRRVSTVGIHWRNRIFAGHLGFVPARIRRA